MPSKTKTPVPIDFFLNWHLFFNSNSMLPLSEEDFFLTKTFLLVQLRGPACHCQMLPRAMTRLQDHIASLPFWIQVNHLLCPWHACPTCPASHPKSKSWGTSTMGCTNTALPPRLGTTVMISVFYTYFAKIQITTISSCIDRAAQQSAKESPVHLALLPVQLWVGK